MRIPDNISEKLEKEYGIDYTILGKATMESVVRNNCEKHRLQDADNYFELLTTSGTLFKEFVDMLLVPETWFFRDKAPFAKLREWATKIRSQKNHLRVLSVPCSTGEETYSIAMSLQEAGWSSSDYKIVGIDLSDQSIKEAKKGIYKRKSFRGNVLEQKGAYFEEIDTDLYSIDSKFQKSVEFHTGNLLDPLFLKNETPFDIVFARNVLIYFTERARTRFIEVMDRLLSRNGILVVGHADNLQGLTDKFESDGEVESFTFRRTQTSKPNTPTGLQFRKSERYNKSPHNRLLKTLIGRSVVKPITKNESILSLKARKYSDKGRHQDALDLCNKHINEHGPSLEAYYLIGEISMITENYDMAEHAFKRALHINRNHRETLFQLEKLKHKHERKGRQ